MASTTHPHAFHFDRAVDSYWEASADPPAFDAPPLASEESCEVAVIGAGFTGLSAALELAAAGVDVRVLEAGHVGWGASGRNGGFACIGSHKLSYGRMIQRYGLDATKSYYRHDAPVGGAGAENLERFAIDAWASTEGEVTLAHLPSRVEELREEQGFLAKTFGEKTEFLSRQDLKEQGLSGPELPCGPQGADTGFGIHPLNYARGLARAAIKSRARGSTASRRSSAGRRRRRAIACTHAAEC
jgi:glycine/D-amino acid oxidase-like deaminating enzyme